MENKLTRCLYDHSPTLLKDVFASIYGWHKNRIRFTAEYDKWASFFKEAHQYTEEQLAEFQCEKLKNMIRHCYDHVPYYRRLFDDLKLKPQDIKHPDDLKKLPIIDKEQVRELGDSLLADIYDPKSLLRYPTSGSTGTPLKLYWSREMAGMETAFVWTRYFHRMKFGDPWSIFTGLEIVRPGRNRPPFWRNNWAANERMYSIFHLSEENLKHYFEALNSRYSKFYSGYASVVYVIADYMERNGLRLRRPPEAFFSASEELQPAHKDKIEKMIGCKVWNRYGQGELVGSITEYPCGHLHYDMDYSILEFLPIGQEDGLIKAEVIGTHLHHFAWPLLRYRTGDIVLYDPDETCSKGVLGQIIRSCYGRTGHYYVLPDGSRVYNISVIAKKCRNIRQMQVLQYHKGEIVVRIVPGKEYTQSDEREVEHQFRRKVGNELKIDFEHVDTIERTPAGKYLSIINRMVRQDD